jgi:signal transduction histidine kinase
VVDGAIAAILAILSLSSAVAAQLPAEREPAHIGLMLLQTLPLVLRRRYPLAVLALTGAALFVDLILYPAAAKTLGPLVAIYTVGAELPRRTSFGAIVFVVAVYAVALLSSSEPALKTPTIFFNNLAIILVVWFLGDSVRLRRLLARTAAERDRLLARAQAEDRASAIRGERERIARELHDVVTHHVAVIAIQASAASESLQSAPRDAESAIGVIRRSAREALADMRRMIGLLGSSTDPDTVPSPRLEHLDTLIRDVRAAGLDAVLSIAGTPRPLDDGLELSAYRVVQEALTNALRHSAGSRTQVTITYESDSLTLEVTDDGRGSARSLEPTHEGRGLAGMRQRVALFDGKLECGPQPAGGFRVWARLPTAGTSVASPS